MSDQRVPSPAKWPFFVADLALLVAAFWIVEHYPHPLPVVAMSLGVGCVMAAAWLAVMPYRMHYQAIVRFAESNELNDAVSQINKVEEASAQISAATAQWQGVQDQSARTMTSAREISERIAAEAAAFGEFLQKANDQEKSTLRLEVEKLRRGEGQWLQVVVHLLDHVYALRQAGARSGQPNLEAQLSRFQEACHDVVRRVGLIPLTSTSGDAFDSEKHQVLDGKPQPEPGARIDQTLAVGYSFQGRFVRQTLVSIQSSESVTPPIEPPIDTEPMVEATQSDSVATTLLTEESSEETPIEIPEIKKVSSNDSASGESFRLES